MSPISTLDNSLGYEQSDYDSLAKVSKVLAGMPDAWLCQWQEVWLPVAAHVAQRVRLLQDQTTPVIGIHGGQGSGKSTLSKGLAELYKAAFGWNVAIVSIDDLYLTKAERQTLSETIHPLLATRGVPGTHDVDLGINLFNLFKNKSLQGAVQIPAFDKISDDRLPESQWHSIIDAVDLVIFEGWCVGCLPVADELLSAPINQLESDEDADGIWRSWVNQQLKEKYKTWFSMIDLLIVLQVPDMTAVLRWRSQQEEDNKKLSQSTAAGLDAKAMARFIQHYERLTQQAVIELPKVADLVLAINQDHKVASIKQG
ncbi:MAG: hypothetical protein P1U57_04515 [Oleibacter sp.]|nr:hypothetical protein [Thalassolituus sp.]